MPWDGLACLRNACVAVDGKDRAFVDAELGWFRGLLLTFTNALGFGIGREAAGPVGGRTVGEVEVVGFTLSRDGLDCGDAAGDKMVRFVDAGLLDGSKYCLTSDETLPGVDFVAVVANSRLVPLRPPGLIPSPRSRCSILATALVLPRSRLFSAKGADEVEAAPGAVAEGLAEAGNGALLGMAACLLRTLTASRAAFSTLIACALLLSEVGNGSLLDRPLDFLSVI